jgi:hypothetical protein
MSCGCRAASAKTRWSSTIRAVANGKSRSSHDRDEVMPKSSRRRGAVGPQHGHAREDCRDLLAGWAEAEARSQRTLTLWHTLFVSGLVNRLADFRGYRKQLGDDVVHHAVRQRNHHGIDQVRLVFGGQKSVKVPGGWPISELRLEIGPRVPIRAPALHRASLQVAAQTSGSSDTCF